MDDYQFYKPIIIVSAPRSGSTLLFELMSKSEELWTIGGESHAVIERISDFDVGNGKCDSNCLNEVDATPDNVKLLRSGFIERLQNNHGEKYNPKTNISKPRFLEKTPKNSLRIGLMNKVFPDALYIYLYRNPRENISSIIDAWNSNYFVTYPDLPGRNKPWSMLLPKDWQSYHHSSVEKIAAFQWVSANDAIIKELSKINPNRWIALSYSQLVSDPKNSLRKLFDFCGVEANCADEIGETLNLSRYYLTKPSKNKWHKNVHLIREVVSSLHNSVTQIRNKINYFSEADFDLSIDPLLVSQYQHDIKPIKRDLSMNRNSPCYCQSGIRYKHCHGNVLKKDGSNMNKITGFSEAQVENKPSESQLTFTVSARGKLGSQTIQEFLRVNFSNLPLSQIDSVFGFVEQSTLYGGRIFQERQLSDDDVVYLEEMGIGLRIPFTNHNVTRQEYLDNKPLIEKYHKLQNSVICTNDNLAIWIKEDFPKYDIEASVIKNIDNLRKLENALKIYNTVVLPMTSNYDDEFLDSIVQKNRIRLFANAGCALTCPSKICYPSISQINKYKGGDFKCSQPLKEREMKGMVDFDLEQLREKGFYKFKLLRAFIGGLTGH